MACIVEPPASFSSREGQPVQDARRYTKEEWEAQRPFIEGMYPIKGITLKSIADMLKFDRGFIATPRQLKRKIGDWSLDKNLKAAEMKVILRKMEQRRQEGKETSFRVRGQYVEPAKINRWMKRLATEEKLVAMQQNCSSPPAATPEAITYETPPVTCPSSPRNCGDAAEACHGIENLVSKASAVKERSHNVDYFPTATPPVPRAIPESSSQDRSHLHASTSINDTMDVCSDDYTAAIPLDRTARHPVIHPLRHSFDNGVEGTAMNYLAGRQLDASYPASYPPPISHNNYTPKFARYNPETSGNPSLNPQVIVNSSRVSKSDQDFSGQHRYRYAAEQECRQRLESLQAKYGPKKEEVLETISQLAGILCEQGRYEAAETFLKHLAAARRTSAGENHLKTLLAFMNLSCIWLILGKVSAAEALCKSISMRASNSLLPSHPLFTSVKEIYAACMCGLGRYEEAEALFDEVLHTRQSSLTTDDPAHPAILNGMENIALMLKEQGTIPECSNILRKVMEMSTVRHGSEDPNTLRASSILGLALYLGGDLVDAMDLLAKVSMKQRAVLGPYHPHYQYTRIALASVYSSLGWKDDGEMILREILRNMQGTLEPLNSRVMVVEMTLAQSLHDQEKFEEGERLARKVHDKYVELYGPAHRRTCNVKRALGRMYDDQGRFDDSLSMLDGAIKGFAQCLGKYHETTKGCKADYAEVVRQMEKLRRANVAITS
ncbi:hypothetical protein BKA64DRAFT_635595 [Cadophora sp. MPI-SDFR-AT-0126]|nr:hypothetical protein BKA64DRAFT_635595 [Leotiomycetes sp. MPI-SDFR-AT-0126]